MVSELAQKVINKRPYLETKIVTYVNNPGDDGIEIYYTDKPLQGKYKCRENIDRIKLPCYCTFEWRGKRRLGMIQNHTERGLDFFDEPFYELHEIDKQTHQIIGSNINFSFELESLIKKYKINIGKVKLTYYETIGGKPIKQTN